jgi:hypothetical protein
MTLSRDFATALPIKARIEIVGEHRGRTAADGEEAVKGPAVVRGHGVK